MKKDKNPSYIKIGIFTVITTLCWIFFSAYRTLTSSPAPSLSTEILASFDPKLDTTRISEIESSIFFEEGQTQPVVNETATPTPEPSPTLEPETTAEPVTTQEPEQATTSGEVIQ